MAPRCSRRWMSIYAGITLFYLSSSNTVASQLTEEPEQGLPMITTTVETADTTSGISYPGPSDVEILTIFVLEGVPNAVWLTWSGNNKANLTYGVHFGIEESELEYPKLTTTNTSALIEDLEHCTRYSFAVVTLRDANVLEEAKVNPNTVRTVITGFDQTMAPVNLTAELEPKAHPCLYIKWSTSCPNVVVPIGYVISVYDERASRYDIITLPKTKRSDLVYQLPVEYGDAYEIKVSSSFPGSKAVGPLIYQVPQPLQPFKLRVTVNREDQAFLIYWAEPFIPLTIGRYYYQVFVYPGQDLEAPYEKYYVTRPVMVYKGERGEYSFCVNFATVDRKHVSKVTKPVYANLNGESYELNTTLPETPDR